jgi:hypothetical protein
MLEDDRKSRNARSDKCAAATPTTINAIPVCHSIADINSKKSHPDLVSHQGPKIRQTRHVDKRECGPTPTIGFSPNHDQSADALGAERKKYQ